MMNIIFEGDWVKILGKWSQVIGIEVDDMIMLSRLNDYGQLTPVNANSTLIEKVLSDLEMQEILETV